MDRSAEEAQKFATVNPRLKLLKGFSYLDHADYYEYRDKNYDEAILNAERALSLAPYQIEWYEVLSHVYFIAGYQELLDGNRDLARDKLVKAIGVPDLIKGRLGSLSDKEISLWKDAPLLSTTPAISLRVGVSLYLLGNWPEAETFLQAAMEDDKSRGEAAVWLSILKDKQGKTQEASNLLEQAKNLVPQVANSYDRFKNLEIIQ
jgi:tetratricopeptide (TPR) repeat protein